MGISERSVHMYRNDLVVHSKDFNGQSSDHKQIFNVMEKHNLRISGRRSGKDVVVDLPSKRSSDMREIQVKYPDGDDHSKGRDVTSHCDKCLECQRREGTITSRG